MLTGGGLVTKLFLTLVTPWTVVWQAPLFMRFSREEYRSGLPFPSPGGFSPYEMLYGRLFTYINDIFLDPETQTLWSYTMAIGQFQQEIYLWGANQDPKDSEGLPLYAPGTQVLFKIWKDGSPNSPLQPTLKGSYPVILSTPTAVKVPGNDSWIH